MDEKIIFNLLFYFLVQSIFCAILIVITELFRYHIPKKRGKDVTHKYQTKKRVLGNYIFLDLLCFCTVLFTFYVTNTKLS